MKVLVVCSRPSVQDGLGERLMRLVPGMALLQANHLVAAEAFLSNDRHNDIDVIVLDAATPADADTPLSTATTTYHGFLVRTAEQPCPIIGIASNPAHVTVMVGRGCVPGDINDLDSLATAVLQNYHSR